MHFDTGDDSFRRNAIAWLQSLADDKITDLPTVFSLSPGYYPTTLVGLWRIEASRRGLENTAPYRLPARRRHPPAGMPSRKRL